MQHATSTGSLRLAARVLREEGPRIFWLKALGALGIYRRLLLIRRSLDGPAPPVSAQIPISVELLGAADLPAYRLFRPASDLSALAGRLEAGQLCFLVKHEGRIVHATWAAAEKIWVDYLGVELPLEPGEVCSHDSYTLPVFRGRNLSPARSLQMAKHLREAGFRSLVATVSPENLPSLRAAEKTGYRVVGTIGYVKLGPWRRDFCRIRNGGTEAPDAEAEARKK